MTRTPVPDGVLAHEAEAAVRHAVLGPVAIVLRSVYFAYTLLTVMRTDAAPRGAPTTAVITLWTQGRTALL